MGLLNDRKNIRDDRKYRKRFRQEQWDHDKEVFDYENAYNAPISQKQRLVEANLNPALMYDTAPQNVGSATSSTGQPSDMKAKHPLEAINEATNAIGQGYDAYMQVKKFAVEKDLAQSQIDKNNSETALNLNSKPGLMDAQTKSTLASSTGKEIQNQYTAEQNQLKTEAMKIANKGGNLSVQEKETRLKYLEEFLDLQNTEKKETISLLRTRLVNIMSDTALKNETAKRIAVQKEIDAFEANMRSQGTSFSDSAFDRSMIDAVNDYDSQISAGATMGVSALVGFLGRLLGRGLGAKMSNKIVPKNGGRTTMSTRRDARGNVISTTRTNTRTR